MQRKEQMAVALRKSKRMLILSKKRWDLAMGQVYRMEEQFSEAMSTHISEEQYSELAFSHLHEEQLDPFAAPPVTDLEHLFEFSTKYPSRQMSSTWSYSRVPGRCTLDEKRNSTRRSSGWPFSNLKIPNE